MMTSFKENIVLEREIYTTCSPEETEALGTAIALKAERYKVIGGLLEKTPQTNTLNLSLEASS